MGQQYWLKHDGELCGPYSGRRLKILAAGGQILHDDRISADKQLRQVASTVLGLFPPPEEHHGRSPQKADEHQRIMQPDSATVVEGLSVEAPTCAHGGGGRRVSTHKAWLALGIVTVAGLVTILATCSQGYANEPGEQSDGTAVPRKQAGVGNGSRKGQAGKALALDLGKGVMMKLIHIKAGKFMMGSMLSAEDAAKRFNSTAKYYKNEHPQHLVTLINPFYMSATEVTRGQFAAFVANSGYKTAAEKEGWAYAYDGKSWGKVTGASWRKPGFPQTDSHPVVCVSWDDAAAFCTWLRRKTGKDVSLPTEAQWEYACRAGGTTLYSFGDNPEELHKYANYCEKSCALDSSWKDKGHDDGYGFTSPVGSYKANAWGLYDMHGNVWEWCSDWYAESYANAGDRDPKGAPTGTVRVLRGGSWVASPQYCRAASRYRDSPIRRISIFGFRVVIVAGSSVDKPGPAATSARLIALLEARRREIDKYIAQGRAGLAARDPENALIAFEKALALDNDNKEAKDLRDRCKAAIELKKRLDIIDRTRARRRTEQ